MTIINGNLTTIGGTSDMDNSHAPTNALVSLIGSWHGRTWKSMHPPMPTMRMSPAAITTSTHLVVAGGGISIYDKKLSVVEVMDIEAMQWFKATSLPQDVRYPQMTSCGDHLFLCEDSAMFSCNIYTLIRSSIPASDDRLRDLSTVWMTSANIPVKFAPCLATLKGYVLAIGGKDPHNNSTGDIHCYDMSSNLWTLIGRMPTPRSHVLSAVLSSGELVVVGGVYGKTCITTEIGLCSS